MEPVYHAIQTAINTTAAQVLCHSSVLVVATYVQSMSLIGSTNQKYPHMTRRRYGNLVSAWIVQATVLKDSTRITVHA